jgi:hypothetical protein
MSSAVEMEASFSSIKKMRKRNLMLAIKINVKKASLRKWVQVGESFRYRASFIRFPLSFHIFPYGF